MKLSYFFIVLGLIINNQAECSGDAPPASDPYDLDLPSSPLSFARTFEPYEFPYSPTVYISGLAFPAPVPGPAPEPAAEERDFEVSQAPQSPAGSRDTASGSTSPAIAPKAFWTNEFAALICEELETITATSGTDTGITEAYRLVSESVYSKGYARVSPESIKSALSQIKIGRKAISPEIRARLINAMQAFKDSPVKRKATFNWTEEVLINLCTILESIGSDSPSRKPKMIEVYEEAAQQLSAICGYEFTPNAIQLKILNIINGKNMLHREWADRLKAALEQHGFTPKKTKIAVKKSKGIKRKRNDNDNADSDYSAGSMSGNETKKARR